MEQVLNKIIINYNYSSQQTEHELLYINEIKTYFKVFIVFNVFDTVVGKVNQKAEKARISDYIVIVYTVPTDNHMPNKQKLIMRCKTLYGFHLV